MSEQKMREALERAQQDINWMLNSGQFLNGYVFKYIDEALADQPDHSGDAAEIVELTNGQIMGKHMKHLGATYCEETEDRIIRFGRDLIAADRANRATK